MLKEFIRLTITYWVDGGEACQIEGDVNGRLDMETSHVHILTPAQLFWNLGSENCLLARPFPLLPSLHQPLIHNFTRFAQPSTKMGKGKNQVKKPASEGGKRTSEKKNGEFTLKRVKGKFSVRIFSSLSQSNIPPL